MVTEQYAVSNSLTVIEKENKVYNWQNGEFII